MQADTNSEPTTFWHRAQRLLRYWTNLLLIPLFVQMVLETSTGQTERGWDYAQANLFFCLNFLAEWVLSFALSKSKVRFLRDFANLTDLISSIPFGYFFQGLRVVRLLRVLRVLRLAWRARRFKGKGGKLIRAAGLVGSISFSGALAFRILEPQTTNDFFEAFWWSVVTLSTVGYGDVMPATEGGRVVAMLIILAGIGVIGYAAGFMTSLLEDEEEDEILMRVRAIDERLARLAESLQHPDRSEGGEA